MAIIRGRTGAAFRQESWHHASLICFSVILVSHMFRVSLAVDLSSHIPRLPFLHCQIKRQIRDIFEPLSIHHDIKKFQRIVKILRLQ